MSRALAPIPMIWDGEAMVPIKGHAKRADEQYVIGEVYTLVSHEDRSGVSHRHYFASINEAWQNLPEQIAADFPSSEHLRKWCLIKAGYRDERTFVGASKAEALRLASFIKPIDDFAVVTVSGCVVTSYTAKSQSMKAMGRADFQKSKDDVLGILSGIIQVAPADLASTRAA